jgi:hypothetical protein
MEIPHCRGEGIALHQAAAGTLETGFLKRARVQFRGVGGARPETTPYWASEPTRAEEGDCRRGVVRHGRVPGRATADQDHVNIKADAHNCGACGNDCGSGAVCMNGTCVAGQCGSTGGTPLCASGFLCCPGQSGPTCVVPTADNQNCGACGNACPAGNRLCSGVLEQDLEADLAFPHECLRVRAAAAPRLRSSGTIENSFASPIT